MKIATYKWIKGKTGRGLPAGYQI